MRSPLQRSAEAAIGSGVGFLLQQQDRDGFWREFLLQPGASESWTTAWVGWCLERAIPRGNAYRLHVGQACDRAAKILWPSRREGGWGYNRRTGPDADTTSWVLRFLYDRGLRTEPAGWLSPYIDAGGGVHTFRELDFGAWTGPHDDVAANAGLALLPTPAGRALVGRIRRRLVTRFPGETYWWSTPAYGVAGTLRFLAASGGLSPEIRGIARRWIGDLPDSDSSFEIANRLMTAIEADPSDSTALLLVNRLLDLAGPDGWPGSSFLLVPPRDGTQQTPPNPELRGLLTTGLCVRILCEWIDSHQ
jgi:hypothetical protein